MTLNNKIIKVHQEYSLYSAKENYIQSLKIVIVATTIGVALLLMVAGITPSLIEQRLMFFLAKVIFIAQIVFCGILCIKNRDQGSLIDFMNFYLHYLLPKNKERQEEIDSYVNMHLYKPQYFIKDEVFSNLNKYTIHQWLKDNVSESKTILKLCHQRIFNKNRSLNLAFIYWTQLIPKVENIDTLKMLLLSSKLPSEASIEKLDRVTQKSVSSAFRDYTDSDLIRFFTSPLNIEDYCKALELVYEENDAFPVESNALDLICSVKELISKLKASNYDFPKGRLKEGKFQGLDLKQCLNTKSLIELGASMKNCVFDRNRKCMEGKSYIYVLYSGEKPSIVFELRDGQLVQMKKKYNRALSDEDEQLVKNIVKGNYNE